MIDSIGRNISKRKIGIWNDLQKIKDIILLYKDELINPEEISKMFNCSHSTISRILKENNALMSQSERNKIIKKSGKIILYNKNYEVINNSEKIIRMYKNELMSIKEISQIFNCSETPVYNVLKENKAMMNQSERRNKLLNAKKIKVWNKGLTAETDERVKKNSNSETLKRMYKEGELKSWSTGLTKETNESLRQLSESRKGEGNPMFGKIPWNKVLILHYCKNCNKEIPPWYKFCSRKCFEEDRKKNWSFPESAKEKLSLFNSDKWRDPLYKEKAIKRLLGGLIKRPTSYEKRIAELCIENSLPFIYTGNGQFLINFKNPDFVDKQNKIVIEVFYSWFKIRDYGSVENYKEFCRKKYNSAGWKVIFIDENEVDVKNWKELCLNKILGKESGKIL